MLKNAILDAKNYENFAKIWRNFDRNLTKFLTKFWQIFDKFLLNSALSSTVLEAEHRSAAGLCRLSWRKVRPKLVVHGPARLRRHDRGNDPRVCARRQARPRHNHSFGGSFSAGSKPIFASKVAFFSIFQNLQENHLLASKFCKFLPKSWKKLQKKEIFWQILANFAKCSDIRKFLVKFCGIFCRILHNCVDFEKC